MAQIPGSLFEQKILRKQRSHRADINDVAVEISSFETFIEERVDDRSVAPLYDGESRILFYLVHETHAACAHHAAVAVKENISPEVVPSEHSLRFTYTPMRTTLFVGVILQLALSGLVTYRAI
tara:strand:- start:625 stop:993 length:369 start_codon:yes stop_codon:yes gene_type:complete